MGEPRTGERSVEEVKTEFRRSLEERRGRLSSAPLLARPGDETTFCQAAFFVRAKLTDRKEEEANGAQRSQLNYSRLSISLGSGALKAFSRPQVS